MDVIRLRSGGHARALLLCRWSGKLNSSALQRCPKLIAITAIEHQAREAIKSRNARLSACYICLIMTVRHSYLSGRSRRMPTVHSRVGGRSWIWHQHLSKQYEPEFSPDLVRAPDILHSSTTLTSIWSIALKTKRDPFAAGGCRAGGVRHLLGVPTHSASFAFIVCLCDLQANENLIQGFGPGDMIDRIMTRWLPTEPME